jgi:hypothetical protein
MQVGNNKTYDKSEITLTMKETIKQGNDKIGKKRQNMITTSSTISKTCIDNDNKHSNSDELKIDDNTNRCQGEKKKGGQCSRRAKNGKYCETHSSEKKELERRMEGGIYVYRNKDELYDIEELMQKNAI